MQWGTPEQKQRYIPRIPSAEEIWCQGLSEPNHGSDLAAVETRAIDEGDHFIVNGSKVWTSNAHHADFTTLLCRTDPSLPKHKGLSYLLVDMKSPGVTVRPLVQMTGESGFNQVFFEDVAVPKANLVGQKNQGWMVAMTNMMFERTIHGGRTDMMVEVQAARRTGARRSNATAIPPGTTATCGSASPASRARRRRSSTPAIASSPASSRDCRPAPKAR